MSDDLIKAEIRAVRALKQGVGRYAEHIRDAGAQARREIAAAERKTQEAVERRRGDLDRIERELGAAQEALSRCRENCGGLQQRVHEATQRRNEAKLRLDRARKAAQLAASAQSDLLKVLQTVEAKVGENSSVASSALADLDARLATLPHFDVGSALRGAAIGATTFVNVATAIPDVAQLVGNAAAGVGYDNGLKNSSLRETREDTGAQEKEYWADTELERTKRGNSGKNSGAKP